MRTREEDSHPQGKESVARETTPAHTLTLDVQPPERRGSHFLSSSPPVCAAVLPQLQQTDGPSYQRETEEQARQGGGTPGLR